MPVYLGDIEQPTTTKCQSCGAVLTVAWDSAGRRIVGPCQKCLDAKKRSYGNVKV